MLHNEITNKVQILSTGYSEGTVQLEDGEEILPSGYYMEVQIDNEDFVIPIDAMTYKGIHNAITSVLNIGSVVEELTEEAV